MPPDPPVRVTSHAMPEALQVRWNTPRRNTQYRLEVQAGAGTFILTFVTPTGTQEDGSAFSTSAGTSQATSSLARNADRAAVLAALEALSNIDPGDVEVWGGPLSNTTPPDGGILRIEFKGQYAGVNLGSALTANFGSLTGGTTPPSPDEIADIHSWFSAQSLSALLDGEPVRDWTDDSENGHHLQQLTEVARPAKFDAVQNGLPVVRFDGGSDFMQTAAFPEGEEVQPNTVFVVAKKTAGTGFRVFVDGTVVTNRHAIGQNSGGSWFISAGTDQADAASDTNWHVFTAQFDATDILRIDGTQVISGNAGAHTLTGFTVGARYDGTSSFWDGDIAEIIIFDRALTATERNLVEWWLATKYTITGPGVVTRATLEGPHPMLEPRTFIHHFEVQLWRTDYDTGTFVASYEWEFGEGITHPTDEPAVDYLPRVRSVDDVGEVSSWINADPVEPLDSGGSDGNAPASSPTPVVKGGINYLAVAWAAITNADPVTYEVHVSTSSGFTPGAGTKAGEIAGTGFFVRSQPNGDALEYNTTYFVKLIAKDNDGAATASTQASGSLVQADSPDIAVDSIVASHILAGEVTADKLAAVIVLASVFKTAESGQRVEITPGGIRLYDPTGTVLIDFPTAGNPSVQAVLTALGLTVTGDATFRQMLHMEAGSSIHLMSGISDPTTAPVLSPTWEQKALGTFGQDRKGLFYDANGFGSQPTFLVGEDNPGITETAFAIEEYKASDGSLLRSNNHFFSQGWGSLYGVARLGSFIFVLCVKNSNITLSKFNQSNFTFVSDTTISLIDAAGTPCLGSDGTNLLVGVIDSSGSVLVVRKYSTTPALVSTLAGTVAAGTTTDLRGIALAESLWWVTSRLQNTVRAFSTSTANPSTNDNFPTQDAGSWAGVTHDGSNFWTMFPSFNTNIVKHTNWKWTTESAVYWCRYTWLKDNSPGGRGAEDYETKPSPVTSITHKKRARLVISMPAPPGVTPEVSHAGIYIDRGASEPTLDLAADQAVTYGQATSTARDSFATGGAAPPSTNTFPGAPGGTPAMLTNANEELILDAQSREPFWQVLGSTTLSSAADVLTLSSLPAKKFLRIIMLIAGSGTYDVGLKFNNDSGQNYSMRSSVVGGADTTLIRQIAIPLVVGATDPTRTLDVHCINLGTREKICTVLEASGAVSADAAPNRREIAGKWANTSDQITRVDIVNPNTGDYAAGTTLIVLGHD